MARMFCKPLQIGLFQRLVRGKRELLASLEEKSNGLFKGVTELWEPAQQAKIQFRNFVDGGRDDLDNIVRIDGGRADRTLQAVFNPQRARDLHGATAKDLRTAKRLEERVLIPTLMEAGLSKQQALKFLREDVPRMRELGTNRFDKNDLFGVEFQPYFQEVLNGHVNLATNNAYAFAHDLRTMVGRERFLKPITGQLKNVVLGWDKAGRGKIDDASTTLAKDIGNGFVKDVFGMDDQVAEFAAKHVNTVLERLAGAGLMSKRQINQADVTRYAGAMQSWYSGFAMSARPALVMRNMTQNLLAATKVGYRELPDAYNSVFGKNKDEFRALAGKDLGMSPSPFVFSEIEQPLGRGLMGTIRRLQSAGLIPYRWADRVNNRYVSYAMGFNSVNRHAADLTAKRITWRQFMHRTGIAGESPVDQERLRRLLLSREIAPDVQKAAREYGKLVANGTQFIYDGINAPSLFKGVGGRMFGQFGIWPIAFTEYMWANLRNGDAAYRTLFATRWAAQKAALGGVGLATGIDTSSWNYAMPLTFDGGPYFQLFRDVGILGTSINQFDRTKARGNVERFFGRAGLPFITGAANPLGGLTTDVIEGIREGGLSGLLGGLGFNLRR